MREKIETDREKGGERKKQMVKIVFFGGGENVHCTLLTCSEISISVVDTWKIFTKYGICFGIFYFAPDCAPGNSNNISYAASNEILFCFWNDEVIPGRLSRTSCVSIVCFLKTFLRKNIRKFHRARWRMVVKPRATKSNFKLLKLLTLFL